MPKYLYIFICFIITPSTFLFILLSIRFFIASHNQCLFFFILMLYLLKFDSFDLRNDLDLKDFYFPFLYYYNSCFTFFFPMFHRLLYKAGDGLHLCLIPSLLLLLFPNVLSLFSLFGFDITHIYINLMSLSSMFIFLVYFEIYSSYIFQRRFFNLRRQYLWDDLSPCSYSVVNFKPESNSFIVFHFLKSH